MPRAVDNQAKVGVFSMLKPLRKILCPAAAALALVTLTSCSDRMSEKSFFAMDTIITLTVCGDNAPDAVSAAEQRIRDIEKALSATDAQSDIYRVNHSGGNTTVISADTAELLSFTLDVAERTGGALDPTVYPLLLAWGFTTEENRVPAKDEIARLLECTGYENVSLSDTAVTLPQGFMLDMGAVGKGYAGDKAAQTLSEHGVASALLDLGGNIQAIGTKPDGSPWRIALRDPSGGGTVGILELCGMAAVTSGAYERYFTNEDGNIYGHIIDPKTGCPAESDLMQVTVIAGSGAYADALSTALYVTGLDRAKALWRGSGDFEMILIDKDGNIHATEGISGNFTPNEGISVKVIDDEE